MTSIEWLENELIEKKIIRKDNLSTYHDFPTTFELLFWEAKEMHKQEIIDAAERWKGTDFAERYYEETFGTKRSDDHISDVSKMVVYTHDDVIKMMDTFHTSILNRDLCMAKLTPIELPQQEISDEEIEKWVASTPYYGHCTTEYREGLEEGAKWYREQLKSKGNGES